MNDEGARQRRPRHEQLSAFESSTKGRPLTALQDAVLLMLRSYGAARLTLDSGQRRVLRSIVAARIAKDIVDEELDGDLEELDAA
jgi:hypothetical protein